MSVAILWPILLRPGLPAYRHDWSWPFDRARVLSGAVNHFFMWDAAGLGKPNALASDHVFHLLVALPALVVSGDAAAKIVLAAAQCFCAICAYRFARRAFAAHPAAACCSAVFYACSPVVINKIGAGHVSYWFAYALLPFAAERGNAFGREPDRRTLAQIALAVAACTFQLQFAVYATIAAVAATGPNLRRSAAVAAAGAAGALTVIIPSAYALASSSLYVPQLFQAPRIAWQNAMSSGLPDVLWLAHSIVPYYRVPEWSFAGLQICIGIAIVSGILAARTRYAFALLFVCGVIFAGGTSGPAGAVWWWLYAHVPAATVFRESYDANALLALAYAAGLAVLGKRLPAAAAASAALLAAIVPLAAGAVGVTIPNVTPPANAPVALEVLREGRIAALPLDSPVIYNGRAPGGVDIFAPHDARHPALAEYPTLYPLTALSLSRCACEPWFFDALSRMDVSAIVVRPAMQSADLARQHIRGTVAAEAAVRVVPQPRGAVGSPTRALAAPLTFEQSLPADAVSASDPRGPFPETAGAPQAVVPAFDVRDDDPKRVWVSSERWFAAAPDPFARDAGGVTTRSSAPLSVDLPTGRWYVLYESRSGLRAQYPARTVRLPASLHPRWQSIDGGHFVLRALAAPRDAAVYRFARGTASVPSGTFSQASIAAFVRRSPTDLGVRLRSAIVRPALIVFRERYSPHWTIPGASILWHGVGDGYANLFLVASAPERFSITYAPQRIFFALCVFCWLVQAALAALAVRRPRGI